MARVRPWWVHAAFAGSLVVLLVLFLLGGEERNGTVLVSSLAPTLVLAAALRYDTPTSPTAWRLLLVGFGLLVVHNAHSVGALVLTGNYAGGPVHSASLVLGYAFVVAGGLLATMPLLRVDPGGMIDATIIGLSVASVVWIALVHRVQDAHGLPVGEQTSQLVVLLLVSAMVGIVVRAAATTRGARCSVIYFGVSIVAAFTGTLAGALTENPSAGVRTWWVGICWIVAYLAAGAGAAHPAVSHLSHQPRPARLSSGRLAFLGAALALNPLLVTVEQLLGQTPHVLLASLGSLLLVPLVTARIAILARMHAAAERRLSVLAGRDELTGLPNRRAVSEHLDALLARVSAGTSPGAAVLFLDMDEFKQVNDAHGHHAGDALLAEVARRLRAAVRATDLVGRFGGDEFILVLEGDPDAARAAGLAAVEHALEPVVQLGDIRASSRASIGSTVARPGEDLTTEQVLTAADASMYRVKRSRRELGASSTAGRAEPGPAPEGADAPEHVDSQG